jgi:hypothetical protein
VLKFFELIARPEIEKLLKCMSKVEGSAEVNIILMFPILRGDNLFNLDVFF